MLDRQTVTFFQQPQAKRTQPFLALAQSLEQRYQFNLPDIFTSGMYKVNLTFFPAGFAVSLGSRYHVRLDQVRLAHTRVLRAALCLFRLVLQRFDAHAGAAKAPFPC